MRRQFYVPENPGGHPLLCVWPPKGPLSLLLRILIPGFIFCLASSSLAGQDAAPASEFKPPVTRWWLNTYANVRLSDRLFWVAQTHLRRTESPSLDFAGQWAQIYNRHALSYLVDDHFSVSLGGVLRINFNGDQDEQNEQRTVPEWRIWHEYLWAQHLWRGKVYHRVRLEHRWTRGYETNAEWKFRNRWRYMFALKQPINRKHLEVGAFYFGPEVELIMQSGKSVVGDPLEDLRLHGSFGYIASTQVRVAAGLMYSFGQVADDLGLYKQNITLRTHVYYTPDWRATKRKLPGIHLRE
ncbi:DUF2490 domain-containing protein [Neolewinella aurantiaca]|uniref:DUF2490 domain-containing protein n=1 Tax=Neolewinella aurantiaca TaxID=2602767 RepID=A0A5C7FGZ3_9BACT|nr:DUF2490 domain-containing protein [Neolewinella aurantiaca]TXF89013.1 DUF2490 domain-containing protein [Neolewinella aurantiaca]